MAFGATATIEIDAPKILTLECVIEGDAAYVQNRFSAKMKQKMMETQKAGSTAKGRKKRDPKDFDACYRDAMYVSADGWHGIPAPSFRNAMISACRTIGVPMTRAKLSVFIVADGFDDEGTPLVRITHGEPERHDAMVRVASGDPDIRSRPMWKPGWRATLRIRYDADMLQASHVVNLLARAGHQVGIGEGRPDSKDSCGMGWGTFRVLGEGEL
jgi:hypothetical protein